MATLLVAGAAQAAASLGTIAQVAAVGGTILSTAGAVSSANQQSAAMEYQADQLEANATAARGEGMRAAEATRKDKELAISRARTVAAASGGGQDINLLGDLEEEGEYQAQLASWQGEVNASGINAQADAKRYDASATRSAGMMSGANSLLGGAVSFYDKFG